MSDFLSSECPPIPWREAVPSVALGNTAAPGPPSAATSHLRTFGKKRPPRRLSEAPGGGQSSEEDNSSTRNGSEMESWDPMALDHQSREFNSYKSGAGALMQAARDRGGGGGGGGGTINLFITNIPVEVTKDCFRELFGRAGRVQKANLIKQNSRTKETTYGFVEYGTMREAEAAIQMLNNFDMGNGVRLLVKVSETKEEREKRLGKKREEEEFLSTLNCGKYGAKEERPVVSNGYELTEDEMKHCETNPFLPSYKSRSAVPGSPQGSREDRGEEGAGGFSLGGSGGARSLQATMSSINKPVSPSSEGENCVKCGRECKKSCMRCGAPYCGKQCQATDWSRHRAECRKSGGDRESQPPASPPPTTSPCENAELVIREKQHSEDEGFDIPTPSIRELMDVLQQPPAPPKSVKAPSSGGLGRPPVEQKPTLSLPIVGPTAPSSKLPQLPVTPPGSPSLPPPGSTQSATPTAVHVGCEPLSLSEVLEVFSSQDGPLPSLPLGCLPPQRFGGVVTSTLSCVRFSVVLMSVEVKRALTAISQCAASAQLTPADPLYLVSGSKVGFIDANGELYRMEVSRMSVGGDSIELSFHDFGGVLRTSFSRPGLVTLPEEIVTIPCLRYRCCLPHLRCRDLVGLGHLMNVVRGKKVTVSTILKQQQSSGSVYFTCDVHLPDGTDIAPLIAQFLSGTQPVTTSPANRRGSPSPGKRASLLGECPLHFPTPVATPPSLLPPSLLPLKSGDYKLMYMAKDVPVQPLPSSEADFVIVPQVVDSPSSIWAHVLQPQLASLGRLQEDLLREYGGGERKGEGGERKGEGGERKGQVYSPRVGELCVVRHCQDQQFYRAEVLCVNNNGMVDVRFVDYGQREMVLASQIQHIEPPFLTLPVQGLHFSLAGVAPSGHTLSWGDDIIACVRNKILHKRVTARLVQSLLQIHSVSLSDPDCPGRSVAEEMVSNGWCVRSSDGRQKSSPAKMAGVRMVHTPEAPRSPVHSPPSSSHLTTPLASPAKRALGEALGECVGAALSTNSTPSPPSSAGGRRGGKVKVPRITLPVDSELEVVVTSAASPTVFHVQRPDRASLDSLRENTEKLNSMELDPYPSEDRSAVFCVARFAEDGLLYRGRIWTRSGSTFSVKFIDFGNIEEVSLSDMYVLPASCASLPAQGIMCSLQNFRALGLRDQSGNYPPASPQCVQQFRSLVENRRLVISVKMVVDSIHRLPPKHVVEVRDKSGRDVLAILAEAGHAVPEEVLLKKNGGRRPGSGEGARRKDKSGGRGSGGGGWKKRGSGSPPSPCKPWGPTKSESSVRPPPSGGTPVCLTEFPHEPQASPTRSPPVPPPPLATGSPEPGVYPSLSELEATEFPSDREFVEVVITSVANLPNLYVQLATEQSLQSVSKLETELNSGTLPPPSPHPPSEGQLVCCRYPVDNVWYRASVVKRTRGNNFEVQFIDYGNRETVPLANIRPCLPQFLEPPVMCVECSLHGVYPPPPSHQWAPEATSFLQQYCERALLARLHSRDTHSGVPSIQLTDSSSDTGDISIADKMIRAGLAAPNPPTGATPATPVAPSPPTTPSVKGLPLLELPREGQFEVLVLSVDSLTELYIHPVTSESPHYLSSFMNSISDFCFSQTKPPATLPTVGEFCLALFDGSWYRAKVESCNSARETLDVFFVDYGNRGTVQLSQIRAMSAQFTNVPSLVLGCGLAGIEASVALKPDLATCSLLGELATSCQLTCRVVSYQPLLVDLVVPATGRLLREELSSAGKLPPLPPHTLFSMEAASLGGEGGRSMVIPTEVRGPSDFWVQAVTSADLGKLSPLMEQIDAYCSWRSVSSQPLVLGQLCCAQFSEDSVWYRARVVGFLSPSQCQVLFLDYGNTEVCEVAAILPAARELLQLPALAIHCSLAGSGNGEDCRNFRSLVENKTLQAEEKGWERGKALVLLTGEDGPILKM